MSPLASLLVVLNPLRFLIRAATAYRPPDSVLLKEARVVRTKVGMCGTCLTDRQLPQLVDEGFRRNPLGAQLAKAYPNLSVRVAKAPR